MISGSQSPIRPDFCGAAFGPKYGPRGNRAQALGSRGDVTHRPQAATEHRALDPARKLRPAWAARPLVLGLSYRKDGRGGPFRFRARRPRTSDCLQRPLPSRFKRDFPNSSAVYAIVVQAGQTTQINLGNSGRPVVGQLRVPPNSDVKVETGFASIVVCEDIPQPHEPRQFQATVDDRGNFCIDDVPVGSYWMSIITRPSGRFIDVFRFQFTVPPINEKLSQRPVDLGIRTVDLRNPH